jgi:hypothetical protein
MLPTELRQTTVAFKKLAKNASFGRWIEVFVALFS